jgi:arylsulfatase A-like enzyme
MKAIMVMFDSLNRAMLEPYGCGWTKTPNFKRLTERTVTFDNCYAGSLPCMPARRELHTGRYNFLHRSWGPLEPFDDSMPEILKRSGVYTHLVSDHTHYWEDGGGTYHTRYSTWENVRGQEGDIWKGQVQDPKMPDTPFSAYFNRVVQAMKATGNTIYRQDVINRQFFDTEDKMPQAITFANGLEFIEKNREQDQWFLQIETFDPHEPFFASERFREMYPDPDYTDKDFDWPPYSPVNESAEVVEHGKKQYAALLSMCDYYLGMVLDAFDKYDMWKDTMLIVNTDHGFLLGEHDWWGKSIMPAYDEIVHTPLFIWNPKLGVKAERRNVLVQTIDLAPTILNFFGVEIPNDMQGKPLSSVITSNAPVREYALFGYHGAQVNITDGNYVYMRSAVSQDNLYEYTLMPAHMKGMFTPKELNDIQLAEPFSFTKGCRVMKVKNAPSMMNLMKFDSRLWAVNEMTGVMREVDDTSTEVRFANAIARLMRENDAPDDQFMRMGLPSDGDYTSEMLFEQREAKKRAEVIEGLENYDYEAGVYAQLSFAQKMLPKPLADGFIGGLKKALEASGQKRIIKDFVSKFAESFPFPDQLKDGFITYFKNAGRTV